eukprot:CAMPEP_0172556186 /NCGR_PEP_ID=MMETSP1067-20121228/64004_1 /TAXON_ID=265564 ORGANISM="Thalassiosira punctigera, Strain Tpunct2005C2" /NCGR_SAMPLE_ID=MMETSP1067 /ASSEMBLY_ACC=CAM_ASM_000444 /LENGTH=74 /DNA_ID=CAMNT_0013344921 /DNA_START=63 /DNA_END=283 /DNA_ORIENTATION=+
MSLFPVVRNKKHLRSSIHLVFMSILSFLVGFLMSYDAAMVRDDSIGDAVKEKHVSHEAETTSDGAQYAPPPSTT